MKRIGKRLEMTGNVTRKKGFGRPKASSCKDDHLLKFTVVKDRKKAYKNCQQSSRSQKRNKTLSRITITRRLSNAGFVSRRCVKKPLLSQKNIKDRMKFLAEYGKFDSEWFNRVVSSD